ncbi:MAG: pyruvate kinase [Alphaproteobacteria bacterium]|jgi:pyruvate kinase|nr:pyruvate kinase [Alphaproteobacteria bacterium]
MRRFRKAKIVATLGPSSASQEMISNLFLAGVDVFRLNFSHGSHEDHLQTVKIIRALEKKVKRPIGILMDLQGPKLRVGKFADHHVTLTAKSPFRLDMDTTPGDETRVNLPHPEIYSCLEKGTDLLLDDGKLRLRVKSWGADYIETEVIIGGELSDRKGVNVPGVILPISAMTPKDRVDLDFGLSQGVDWVALSFVQRPEDILEARQLIKDKAKIIAKLEKPMAIQYLHEIIDLADGIMVARGDLGVEMAPEDVPSIQKRIIRQCRVAGKPVIVATQMLDSMISNPSPTRAEASDVATAIYDGVDAVMLSAESASGKYPVEAVSMMDRIIFRVEQDHVYAQMLEATRPEPLANIPDAITTAARHVAHTISITAMVTFTDSGATTQRAARERPEVSILAATPNITTARQLALLWGTHPVLTEQIHSFSEMVNKGCKVAFDQKYAKAGDLIIVIAGVPFGVSGGTNILRIAKIETFSEDS